MILLCYSTACRTMLSMAVNKFFVNCMLRVCTAESDKESNNGTPVKSKKSSHISDVEHTTS